MNRVLPFALVVIQMLALLPGCRTESTDQPPPTNRAPDTTSHAVRWRLFKLGEQEGGSNFNDVAILSDTLAYAAGFVTLLDSDGITREYNLARWDGKGWTLLRDFDPHPTGVAGYELYSIFAFAPDDIWIANNAPQHWNGSGLFNYFGHPLDGFISGHYRGFWGTSSRDLYCVTDGGMIGHFDGTAWTSIPSPTDLPINDIWGVKAGGLGAPRVAAIAARPNLQVGMCYMDLTTAGGTARPDTFGLGRSAFTLTSVWIDPGDSVRYLAGGGLFVQYGAGEAWKSLNPQVTTFSLFAVRGTTVNDVFAVGSAGEVLHYNGSTWMSYRTQTALPQGSYRALAATRTLIIAAGADGPSAALLVGSRP